MSARSRFLVLAAAAACALPGVAGVTAGSAGAAVQSASSFPPAQGFPAGLGLAASGGSPTSAECVREFGIACYSPLQVERAYDLRPLYAKGFSGKGRTIVIVDPFGSPTIRRDLATFDGAFGLPARRRSACCSRRARCRRSTRRTPGWWTRPPRRRSTSSGLTR